MITLNANVEEEDEEKNIEHLKFCTFRKSQHLSSIILDLPALTDEYKHHKYIHLTYAMQLFGYESDFFFKFAQVFHSVLRFFFQRHFLNFIITRASSFCFTSLHLFDDS